jgi:alanine racemase
MQNLGSAWIEIDLDVIVSNIKAFREFVREKTKILGIIKGNALGHDALEVAPLLLDNGVSYLGVARVEEGVELRNANIRAPILITSISPKEQIELLVGHDLTATVCDIESVKVLSQQAVKQNKVAKVHIKVETGLGRIGVFPKDALKFVQRVQGEKNIQIEGIYTHFADATQKNKSYTEDQFKELCTVLSALKENGIKIPLEHAANSAVTLDLPNMHLDMVRPGISIFGLYPSPEVKRAIELRPALKFKTVIIYLKKVPAGKSIGYGRTYITGSDTIVATLPVGFADGYPRQFSNSGKVRIRGQEATVIGKVCMDQIMIDVTHIPDGAIGDEVTLWAGEDIVAIAHKLGFSLDGVTTMTDKMRVPKLFIKEGKPYKIKSMLGDTYL